MNSEHILELHTESIDTLHRLFGLNEENIAVIEKIYDVELINRQNQLVVLGADETTFQALKHLLTVLFSLCKEGKSFSSGDIRYAAHLEKHDQLDELVQFYRRPVAYTINGKVIYPKTLGQQAYLSMLNHEDVVFGIGPAGTGKTYLAVALAVNALKKNEVKRIILTRPAVEAGENLGFLPGDLKEKVDPYLRPLYDALYDMLGLEQTERLIEKGIIEIAPLAYMRGRTLEDAYVILDEAQNTTDAQMKMFLTRLGFRSKMVITGDVTQIDLPKGVHSGLKTAMTLLQDIEGIAFAYLSAMDVVRHPVVSRIIERYDQYHQNREEESHEVSGCERQDD